jgi:hypothetical protein
MPVLDRLSRAFANRGALFVGLNMHDETATVRASFTGPRASAAVIALGGIFKHDAGMITSLLLLGLGFQAEPPRPRPPDSVRVIRAEVGLTGAVRDNTFVLDAQKESFDLKTDKEVIVAFEWDGPPGTHRCELSWLSPDGSVALQTRLDLAARGRRFSGYWSLLLNPTMSPGLWAAEVKVDGVASGSRTFRITGPPLVRPLPPDQLYKLAFEATISIEARLPAGAERRVFSGFALGDDSVITTFEAINAAKSLELTFSDGSRAETDEVWLFSRDLDWALIKVVVPPAQKRLKIAASAKVGDPCVFLNVVEGQRELSPCLVVGENTAAPVLRLSISNRPSQAAFGSPLLSSIGEVLGVVGIDSRPGGGAFDDAGSSGAYRIGSRSSPSTLLVMPVNGIHRPEETNDVARLASFWERGLFSKIVTASRHVGYGFIGAGASGPRGEGVRSSGYEFYASDSVLTALLTWQPREKLDTTLNYACFDSANRMIGQGKPLKVSLRPGTGLDSSSPIDVSRFKPGEYRLDISLGSEVAWRTYFKILR